MFQKINIYDELVKEKKKLSLLDEVHAIISVESEMEFDILNRIENSVSSLTEHPASVDYSNTIFTSEQIKNTCIKYRLRFLDSKLFKGEIPYEAIMKVKELEKKSKMKFSEFKILAPASLFKLEDRNKDPLLFAHTGKRKYILIHKWGNDLSWHRKILSFPLRTVKSFICTLLAVSILISITVPVDYSARMFIFLISNLFFLSMFAHIGYVRLNQNFSEFEWDSKFVN